MGTTTLITVEEYLHTAYSPDCEFVDGIVLERKVGEKPHSNLTRILTEPATDVLQEPPFIAIEILSAEDTMSRVIEKLREYAAIGTPNIWLFDPRQRQMFTFHGSTLTLLDSSAISTDSPYIEFTREEIFPN